MATLRIDKWGTYYIDIRILGSRRRISLETKNKREAETLFRLKKAELAKNPKYNLLTLEEFKELYLAFSKSRKSPATADKEKHSLEWVIELLPEVRYIDDITPELADRFITRLSEHKTPKGTKLSPHSVNSYISAIRSIFSTAKTWKKISDNPFKGVSKLRVDDEDNARILTLDEIKKFFQEAYKLRPYLAELYEFYLLTGVRRNEALRIMWEDVDWQNNLLTIPKTKKRRKRTIFLLPRARMILENRRTLSKPFDFKPHRVSVGYKAVADSAKIKGTKLHSLRKTFATHLQDVGMPIAIVGQMIGDRSDTTREYYTGHYLEMVRGYLSGLEDKFVPLTSAQIIVQNSAQTLPTVGTA